MKNSVIKRLEDFGYMVTAEDENLLVFSIEKACGYIKNYCNISEVPTELFNVAVDMSCSEFLCVLKQVGKLNETYNVENALKSISIGDINLSMDNSCEPSKTFDNLINHLKNREGELIRYRKIMW